MKKIGILIGCLILMSCQYQTKEQRDREMSKFDVNIKVIKLKELNRGKYSPNYFMVDQYRNSYEITVGDYVRLLPGDSIKINTYYSYAEILEFYK